MGKATQVEVENDAPHAATPTGLEIVISKALSPVEVFTANGLDAILERIESETRSIVLDISSKKGREQIASLAHKIAKSKTALDAAGKELVAGWKESAKKVDAERSRGWDRLEALQKEVRQPLTEWEDAEKKRVADHEENLVRMETAVRSISEHWQTMPLDDMQERLKAITEFNPNWQEFAGKAKLATEAAISAITASIVKRQAYDAEQAELARLRKEEEIRKLREHEERIRAEAAEKARIAAESEAKRQADTEAARVKVEQEKAEQERVKIRREKDEAEARAAKAESDRIASEKLATERVAKVEAERIASEKLAAERAAKSETDRIAAEAKAKEDARRASEKAAKDKKAAEEAAAKRERDRIADQQKAEADATAEREADKAHRAKVNNEALHVLKNLVDEKSAKAVIEAIAKGNIPHISIRY